jgi:hypothetical protein
LIGKLLSFLGTGLTVGGVVLVATGAEVPGAILVVAGLLLGAAIWLVSVARRGLGEARELWRFASGGRPTNVRVVSVEPPRTVIRSPRLSVELEVTNEAGTRRISREIGVPRGTALVYVLGRKLPFLRGAQADILRAELQQRAAQIAG